LTGPHSRSFSQERRLWPRSSGPVRVCHLGKFYPPALGGIETHVAALARSQAELGAKVRVLCVHHLDRHGRDVTWDRFAQTETVEEWDGPVRVTRMGRRACVARLDFCFELPSLLSRLRRAEVDLFHLHVPNPTMLLALAALRPRVPLVVTYHSDVIKQKVLQLAVQPFERVVFHHASMILSDSPPYAEGSATLQRYCGKLGVLPLGIDLGPFLRPVPAALEHASRLKAEHGCPLWLAVGRLVYYKGLHNAIRALALVPGRLMIVGQGPLADDLRRLAAEVGVAERVCWPGRAGTAELVGAYRAATACWFPSNDRSEGFGLVQVEAMASGCPVLNTSIPHSGVSWVSRHEETGLTVRPNDPAGLAAAANRLLHEPGLRERLALNARERARLEFDQALMARRSLEIYGRVLENGSSKGVHEQVKRPQMEAVLP
jgi:glycosyltransferase involved in cell wall biosynthesis